MEFKTDEAAVAGSVRAMLETGRVVQVGIGSSVGVRNAPLFDYLMALPLAISSDPRVAVVAIALANVGAVLVTCVLGRRLWGTTAGAVAGVLFALAPWAVAFSRKLWEQDLEPCFAAIALYALVRGREGSAWWAAGAVACWLWMWQVHPSAVLLAPIFLAAGPAFWRSALRPPLLAGLLVGVAPLAPFAVYQVTHGWPDLHALVGVASRTAKLDGMAWQAALSALTGWATPELESVPFDHFLADPPLFSALSALATAALLAALLFAGGVGAAGLSGQASPWLKRQAPTLLLLLAWIALPVLLATRHSVPVYPHYELTAFPAAFLLMGFAVAFLTGRVGGQPNGMEDRGVGRDNRGMNPPAEQTKPTSWAAPSERRALLSTLLHDAAWLILGAMVIGWAAILIAFLRALPPEPFVWDYGVPYATSAQIAAAGKTAAIGGRLWLHVDPVIQPPLGYLLRTVPNQRVLPSGVLVLPPAGQSAGYLIDDVHDAEVVTALRAAGAKDAGQVMYMDSLHHALALRWNGSDRVAGLAATLQPLSVRLENGVQFLGFAVQRPDAQTLQVEIAWRVTRVGAGVTDSDLALYTHLMDGTGKMLAQKDDMPFPSAQWQAGETIVTWLDVPLKGVPSGQYALRAGMYRRPSVRRVAALDAAGKSQDGEFSLGQVTLAP